MRVAELFLLFESAAFQKDKRAEFIIKTYGNNWKPIDKYEKIEDFVDALKKADPSKNGAYMQWLAKLIIKNPEHNRVEDLRRTTADLKLFDENKSKIQNKDIMSYKTFADLFSAVEPFTKKRPKTAKEKQAEKIEKLKAEGIVDVYAGAEGWIKIPMNKKAAQFLGQSTRWCTAGRCNNMFDSYNKKDRLFVIYDKASKERFQLHIESGQFADVTDKMVGMDKVPKWAREHIVNWYKKNMKEIGLKHVMTFAKMGHEDIAKGTDHEELVDLMKQYGVI